MDVPDCGISNLLDGGKEEGAEEESGAYDEDTGGEEDSDYELTAEGILTAQRRRMEIARIPASVVRKQCQHASV